MVGTASDVKEKRPDGEPNAMALPITRPDATLGGSAPYD
jgi:hypothetical protein